MMKNRDWLGLCLTLAVLWGCSPRLNWRTVPLPQAPLTAQFPCKPDHFSRRLLLAGETVEVGLSSCMAGDQTFAIAAVNMKTAERLAAGLQALRVAANENWGGTVSALKPLRVNGLRATSTAEYFSAELMPTSGSVRQARLLFFAQGVWVYQATVMGERLESEALESFFEGLQLPS